ncbi:MULTISPECIES: nucleotide exchange factor GrpE [Hungatella]|uniref:nucleotide exchange factor GrpE n=1 Tax=Hungatella TaxID=1649459 RepID=UPI00311AB251
MSSEETRIEEELAEEAMKAEDTGSVNEEIEKGETEAAETEACAADAADEKSGDEEPAEEKQAEPEKKGFFGKKKDPKDAKIEELTDRLQRNMAEFDNYRKRTEKEKSAMFEIGARDIIEKILPVVDNFERGLAAVPEEDKGTPFAEGMEKIYKQLMKTLEDTGVKPIEAVGQPFDPNFHNAVMHIDDESLGENTVAMELQKGYTYRDTVVRHSMVQVAN